MPVPRPALPAGLLRRCLDHVRHGITLADARSPDLPLVYANEAFQQMTGYPLEELLGRNCRLLQGDRHTQPGKKLIRAAIDQQKPVRTQLRNVRKNGEAFWNDLSLTPVFDRHGRLTHYIGVQSDVTETLRQRADLLRHQRKLRALARQLVQTEEAERRRMACDVHDFLGQTLTACHIQLGEVARALGPDGAPPALHQACTLVREALAQTRGLLSDLSPPVLHELGLGAALHWLADQAATRHGLPLETHISPAPADLPVEFASLLFRSARELLLNAGKHAHADRLHLLLASTRREIVLEVIDDGRGLPARPPRPAEASACGTGFGLFSIRDRAEQLGGSLTLASRPGKGTHATLRLPLPPARRSRRRRKTAR